MYLSLRLAFARTDCTPMTHCVPMGRNSCECGVNGGRAHHIGVVAGGADGKTEPGFQEEAEEDAHKHDRDDRDSELIFPGKGGAREQVFHVGKDARRLIHIENR